MGSADPDELMDLRTHDAFAPMPPTQPVSWSLRLWAPKTPLHDFRILAMTQRSRGRLGGVEPELFQIVFILTPISYFSYCLSMDLAVVVTTGWRRAILCRQAGMSCPVRQRAMR